MPSVPPAGKATKLIAGTLIAGRYRITREIGRGGMAYVYEAKHADIGKRVAVKVLSSEFTGSPVVVERFLREARAAAAVQSPYICDVYDSGKLDDGRPFLVMELLEGESLYERMVRVRQFDPKTTVRIITHVSRGLLKAHAANIVHRDLKPENVFLTTNEDGEMLAKILDFGLAKFYEKTTDGSAAAARLTREGAIFGTPAYMSPEQVQGQGAVDHRADIWALGCIAYECMTGRTVWSTDKGIAMTFAQIASAELPRLTRYRPDLPRSIDAWFEKALSRNILDRYQTAKDLADGFAGALEQGPPSLLLKPDDGPASARAVGADPDATQQMVDLERIEAEAAKLPSQAAIVAAPPPAPVSTPVPTPPASPKSGRTATGDDLGAAVQRDAGASLIDAGTSNTVKALREAPMSMPAPAPSASRSWVLPLLVVAALGVGGFAYWENTRGPKAATAPRPTPSASASSAPSAAASLPPVEPPPALPPGPRWSVLVADAQVKLARGEIDEAQKRVKEAFDSTGAGPARALSEHLAVAAANKGPCKLVGIGRLRPPALVTGVAGRPLLVRTGSALLALYTDDHETQMHDHAYAVSIDPMIRGLHVPIDVTPEAEHVARIEAQVLGERVAIAFVDTRGQAPGLFARWVDAKGTIAGPTMLIGTARSGTPSLAADGKSVWAAWDEKVDNDRMEMFLGRIPASGEPTPAIRIVDLRKGALRPKLAPPEIAVSSGAIELVYRVDRDTERSIQHLHAPLEGEALPSGLPADPKSKDDRSIGTTKVLSSKPDKGDTPNVACGKEGCFVVWHIEKPGSGGGAFAAFIDGKSGQLLWRKKFASSGGRPAVAYGETGARVAWYEGGKVRTASIDKDGIGAPSTLARVAGDQPAPSIAAGAGPGDWTIGWLDFEAGRLEPYALRAMCR